MLIIQNEMDKMARYCSSCGKEIAESTKFCPSCGKAVISNASSPIQSQTIQIQNQIKNPGLAALLSFFISGAGQIYNGQLGKGIIAFISTTLTLVVGIMGNLILIVISIILWIIWICDAYTTAQKINRGEITGQWD